MSRIQVCLVSPYPPPYGGIAHWTAMVTAYAHGRENAEITLINTAPSWRSIHSDGVILRAVGGGIQLVRDVLRLAQALRAKRFDVIHLTTSGHLSSVRDVVISQVAAFFGVPLVFHIRFGRIPAIAEAETPEWRLLRIVIRRAASAVAIDGATFVAVQQHVPEANLCLIPNCVNLGGLPTPKQHLPETKKALFVGWVVATKGIGELFESWSKIRPEGWNLEIVGSVDEAYKAQLQAQFPVASIKFLGLLPHAETMERMAQCDLFVLPSYSEGFPNAVVEAMALGRPIIATKVGAIPEMLQGEAGVLVESRNVEQLSAAILRVTNDADLRKRLGVRAQERAKANYTIEVVFDAYVSLWKRVSTSLN
jgi:glycosyltransferase involved in cell wall biosynthesis